MELAAFKERFKKSSKCKLSETFDGFKEGNSFRERLKIVAEKLKMKEGNNEGKLGNIDLNDVSFEAKNSNEAEINSVFSSDLKNEDGSDAKNPEFESLYTKDIKIPEFSIKNLPSI